MEKNNKRIMGNISGYCWLIILLVVSGAFLISGCSNSQPAVNPEKPPAKSAPRETTVERRKSPKVWTCPMHPGVRVTEAGQCPICGMNLVQETQCSQAKSEGCCP